MSQAKPGAKSENSVSVVRGQHHKFMLIPILAHHVQFFDAGPISFAVEARALGTSEDNMERGASVHVFNADHTLEFARFDCFERTPHYHYIRNAEQHNIVWGYDPVVNGPILPWAIARIRERLPEILRGAGEDALAEQVEREGWDKSVLAAVEKAGIEAHESTYRRGMELAREGIAWMTEWKKIHPQFNTVD